LARSMINWLDSILSQMREIYETFQYIV
jgi:hypothetical protein